MKTFFKFLFITHILVNFESFASIESPLENVDMVNDPITLAFERCIAKSHDITSEQENCAHDAYKNWDKALNEVYQQILSKIKLVDKKKFINSQKSWLNFRDTEFKLIDSIFFTPARIIFKTSYIKERVKSLRINLVNINNN